MGMKDLKNSCSSNLRSENTASNLLILVVISFYMHATVCFNIIKHSAVNVISLSLPRCRYHLIMRAWHFLFFCEHLLRNSEELSRHQIR